MRIAISGAHETGKSTLVAELAEVLPAYRVVEEPYHAMLAEGYAFPERPEAADYEAQLERSIALLSEVDDDDVLFDRCPADFLAYLAALNGTDPDALRDARRTARAAMESLDLVVYVPVESPDRIASRGITLPHLRRRVDNLLCDMLVDDGWGLAVAAALEVHGSPTERARLVTTRAATMCDLPE